MPLRTSHDEWWHLKTGQWIESNGIPENEIFTYTAEEIPWHNHEWLAQLALWKVYKMGDLTNFGGIRAVITFKTLFVLFCYLGMAIYLAYATGAPAVSCFSVAIAAALARRTLHPRPPFISYGFLMLIFCMLLAWRDKRMRTRWLWLLVPIFALWANLHGGFMAGLVFGGGFWIDAGFRWALAWWRLEDHSELRERWIGITCIGLGSALATLATPSGIHLYELPTRVLNDPQLQGIIAEMRPPNWRYVWVVDGVIATFIFGAFRPRTALGLICATLAAFATFYMLQASAWSGKEGLEVLFSKIRWEGWLRPLLLGSLLIVASLRSPRRVGLGLLVILLFFAHQGVNHVRHLPLFGIALAPVMAFVLSDWVRDISGRWDSMWKMKQSYKSGSEMRVALGGKFVRRGQLSAALILAALAASYQFFPEEAVGFVVPSVPFVERFRDPSFRDRNLLLWRGQESRFDGMNEPGSELGAFPKAGVDLLLSVNPPGRIFNGGNYAGYLIWRLSPEKYKVFTDNRYDIYGGKFIRDETIVLHAFEGDPEEGIPSWPEVMDFWGVNTMIVPVKAPIHPVLVQQFRGPSPAWLPIWDGRDGYSIWTRSVANAAADAAPPG